MLPAIFNALPHPFIPAELHKVDANLAAVRTEHSQLQAALEAMRIEEEALHAALKHPTLPG